MINDRSSGFWVKGIWYSPKPNTQNSSLKFGLIFILMLVISIGAYAQISMESSKYYPIYKNETKIVPVYKEAVEKQAYSCLDTKQSLTENVTCYKDVIISVFDKMEAVTVSSKITGYSDGKKDVIGFVNADRDAIYRWRYDIKDRDMINYGRCTDYEKVKEVCDEIN